MWLSNTATALMMMMGMSLILLYEELNTGFAAGSMIDRRAENFSLTLLLGIAYFASIGGFATLIARCQMALETQLRNFSLKRRIYIFNLDDALPMSSVYMILAWFLLTRFVFPLPPTTPFSGRDFIRTNRVNWALCQLKKGACWQYSCLLRFC